jgi:hypothetical protein
MTPEVRDRSPAARPRVRSVQRGSESGAGEDGECPVSKCQDSAAHPLDECGEFRICRSPRGGRRSRNGIAASAASWTAGTERLVAGATAGSGFGGTTY